MSGLPVVSHAAGDIATKFMRTASLQSNNADQDGGAAASAPVVAFSSCRPRLSVSSADDRLATSDRDAMWHATMERSANDYQSMLLAASSYGTAANPKSLELHHHHHHHHALPAAAAAATGGPFAPPPPPLGAAKGRPAPDFAAWRELEDEMGGSLADYPTADTTTDAMPPAAAHFMLPPPLLRSGAKKAAPVTSHISSDDDDDAW